MRLTVIALLLVVSGTATAVAPAKQNRPAQASQSGHCDVGVVSHLGEKFGVKQGDRLEELTGGDVSVEPWHLDDLVTDAIRGAAGNRAQVRRIPYRKDALATRPFLSPVVYAAIQNSSATMRKLAAGTIAPSMSSSPPASTRRSTAR